MQCIEVLVVEEAVVLVEDLDLDLEFELNFILEMAEVLVNVTTFQLM